MPGFVSVRPDRAGPGARECRSVATPPLNSGHRHRTHRGTTPVVRSSRSVVQLLHVHEIVPDSVPITAPETALVSWAPVNTIEPDPSGLIVTFPGDDDEKS